MSNIVVALALAATAPAIVAPAAAASAAAVKAARLAAIDEDVRGWRTYISSMNELLAAGHDAPSTRDRFYQGLLADLVDARRELARLRDLRLSIVLG